MLTGKTKYRVQSFWFKPSVLVLQVYEKYPDGPDDSNGMPMWLEGYRWRDATPEDLINIQIEDSPARYKDKFGDGKISGHQVNSETICIRLEELGRESRVFLTNKNVECFARRLLKLIGK